MKKKIPAFKRIRRRSVLSMRPIFLTMFYLAPHPFVLNSRRKHRALICAYRTLYSTQSKQRQQSVAYRTNALSARFWRRKCPAHRGQYPLLL